MNKSDEKLNSDIQTEKLLISISYQLLKNILLSLVGIGLILYLVVFLSGETYEYRIISIRKLYKEQDTEISGKCTRPNIDKKFIVFTCKDKVLKRFYFSKENIDTIVIYE